MEQKKESALYKSEANIFTSLQWNDEEFKLWGGYFWSHMNKYKHKTQSLKGEDDKSL